MVLMNKIIDRLKYLFRSPKGLVLLAIAFISIVTLIWGMLSGPLAEWGFKDLAVRILGMDLEAAEREGRIIILYHSIAMAVVAILVYFATATVPMKKREQTAINCVVTVGYITAMISGLIFAYFGHNWAAHGVYLVGLSLVFFAGILLAIALWPWRNKYRIKDPASADTRGRLASDLGSDVNFYSSNMPKCRNAPSIARRLASAAVCALITVCPRLVRKRSMRFATFSSYSGMAGLVHMSFQPWNQTSPTIS